VVGAGAGGAVGEAATAAGGRAAAGMLGPVAVAPLAPPSGKTSSTCRATWRSGWPCASRVAVT
jgi:hypothetical protein